MCTVYYEDESSNAFLFILPASGSTLEVLSGVDVTPTDVREHGVRCVCGIGVDSGLMVHCKFCNHWQHGVSLILYTLSKKRKMKIIGTPICYDEILGSQFFSFFLQHKSLRKSVPYI
jgi:hypothetical protein